VNNLVKLAVILLALACIFAVKPYYGGEISIRLNEPTDFSYAPSSYSNLVFYSLIYENLFYLKQDGDIESNIFREYRYDSATKTLELSLKDNVCFSDGNPITANHVKLSINLFLNLNLGSSQKLRQVVKAIGVDKNRILIELIYDDPNIVSSLTIPGLVLTGGSDKVFSGMFYPEEWVKGQYLILKPNPFYPGGRSYLDSLRVVFYDYYYPDVFLSSPGIMDEKFSELNAGVYQNIYMAFPQGKVGKNTRVALYSLMKDFYKSQTQQNMVELNALTSNEESPITLNIKKFSRSKVRSILRYSRVNLYILSSLSYIEESLKEFLQKRRLSLETIFISDNELVNFMNNTSVKFLLVTKTFNRRVPIVEKIKIILKEMAFTRFDETHLKLLNQLDEVENLKNEELLMDLVAKIIEKVIQEGYILPLYQKRFSLYVKNHVKGIELDYYGKPLFRRVRTK
jgi:MarR-like DNA-binding transcriptional regulator SgrR of sgrS sRNA